MAKSTSATRAQRVARAWARAVRAHAAIDTARAEFVRAIEALKPSERKAFDAELAEDWGEYVSMYDLFADIC